MVKRRARGGSPLRKSALLSASTLSTPSLLLLHCLRAGALLLAARLLRGFPVIVFSFIILALSALLALGYESFLRADDAASLPLHRAAARRRLSREALVRVVINGCFHSATVVVWAKGLQECGALRTILLESSGPTLAGFVQMLSRSGSGKVDAGGKQAGVSVARFRWKGSVAALAGYVVLLYQAPAEGSGGQDLGAEILDEIGLAWGMALLLAASLLEAVKAKYAAKLMKDVGGDAPPEQVRWSVQGLSFCVAASTLLPLVVIDFIGEAIVGADYDYSVFSFAALLQLSVVALFVPIFAVASHGRTEDTKGKPSRVSPWAPVLVLVSSFSFAAACVATQQPEPQFAGPKDQQAAVLPLLLAFSACTLGAALPVAAQIVHDADFVAAARPGPQRKNRMEVFVMRRLVRGVEALSWNGQSRSVEFPMPLQVHLPGGKKDTVDACRLLLLRVNKGLNDVLKSRDSRKIFIFLCINFAFMFVEVVMGLWTNSLGLISDAGHMFFDCAALFLGLFASVVSNWRPDGIYSYGYSRIQVISGFVNAVFLVFIAVFVFTESLERISEPPELNHNGLILTSVGGFAVNLVGIIFFHEHAGHQHSHSQSPRHDQHEKSASQSSPIHAHKHGHGHSHDVHQQAHQGTCEHGHEHSHSHGHTERCEHESVHGDVQKEEHDLSHTHGHGHAHDGACDHGHGHNDGHEGHDHSHAHRECKTDHRELHVKDHSGGAAAHHGHSHGDENMKGVFLHIVADLLGR